MNNEPTSWRSVKGLLHEEVQWAIQNVPHPQLGSHVGKIITLSNGNWLVLKHQSCGPDWEFYCILPAPPL